MSKNKYSINSFFKLRDLAKQNASVKEIFQKLNILDTFESSQTSGRRCDMAEHAKLLADLFDQSVKGLTKSVDQLNNELRKFRAFHNSTTYNLSLQVSAIVNQN